MGLEVEGAAPHPLWVPRLLGAVCGCWQSPRQLRPAQLQLLGAGSDGPPRTSEPATQASLQSRQPERQYDNSEMYSRLA